MAKAVIARRKGDDYQDDYFWLCATRMLFPLSKVYRVAYELDSYKSFDDVAVFYSTPQIDERGEQFYSEYYQVKFHVDYTGAATYKSLTDPAFINASKTSILQRLKDAQSSLSSNGTKFHFVTPATIDPNDSLAEIISTQNGEIRLEKLFDNKPKTAMAQIRREWKEHLHLKNDEELERLIKPFRLQVNSPNLEQLGKRVNELLAATGLLPINEGALTNPYRSLIRQLHQRGLNKFSREQLLDHCSREGLCVNNLKAGEDHLNLGIRSFLRWAEFMEDETDDLLDLLSNFDNRHIRDNGMWSYSIVPELQRFLKKHNRDKRPWYLYLDAHTSIAFATGYILDSKSGLNISVMQRTLSGREPWHFDATDHVPSSNSWTAGDLVFSDGSQTAIAISVTHDVSRDVETYIRENLREVGKIINYKISPKPSGNSVTNGNHALNLVMELVTMIKEHVSASRRIEMLHVFIAAPNSFSFLLGRFGKSLGPCKIYEFNFGSGKVGDYCPSIEFPLPE